MKATGMFNQCIIVYFVLYFTTLYVLTIFLSEKRLSLFERFIQLGKHVKIAINISITGAFG